MVRDSRTRREFLAAGAGLGIGTLCAGCSSLPIGDDEPSTDLSGSGSGEESDSLIPPLSPSDYATDEVTVTAFSPIVLTNARETLQLRQQLLETADIPIGPSPRHAGTVLTALDTAVSIYEFVRESDRDKLRQGISSDTYRGYSLYSEGPAEIAVKDPRVIIVTDTERLQVDPRPLLERLIDFSRGERVGMEAERTDVSAALTAASEKHVRQLRTRLSGDSLKAYGGDATATAVGATIEGEGERPSLSLAASAAAPEGSSPPTAARDRLLTRNPLGLPYDQPTRSTSEHVATATDRVQATPGLDENGEPILVDSDTIVDVTAYQFGFDFRLTGADITTRNEVTVPDNRPLGFRVQSTDVVHSLGIQALDTLIMAVPDEIHRGLVFADSLSPDEYGVFCFEYCGAGHSEMTGTLRVVEPAEFETWMNSQS